MTRNLLSIFKARFLTFALTLGISIGFLSTLAAPASVAAKGTPVGTGIYGTGYATVCRNNNSCSTSPAELKVEVYDQSGSTLLQTFYSGKNGSYQESLPAGSYDLKGAPANCQKGYCVHPFGDVYITITNSYQNWNLYFDPVTGLSGVQQ